MKKIPYIVSVEGIDGAGKGTHVDLLVSRLKKDGFKVKHLDFPQYNEFIGTEIGNRLAGRSELDATQLPVKDMSLWYAVDRSLAFKDIPSEIQIIVLNRSTYSNVGFQLARVDVSERQELKDWLLHLEFDVLGIPRPDKVFYLDISTEISKQLVQAKQARSYVEGADAYEGNDTLLEQAQAVYRELAAQEDNFELISCLDAQGALLGIPHIHNILYERLLASM